MITLLCVLVLNYLVSTQASSKSKSVNLALETVLEFDKKDIPTDVKIIDNVQKFLAKVRSILDQSADARRSHRDSIKFTDFVENALIILRTFSDEDLEELVAVVDDELRKYHYKGCKFYELVQNDDFRKYVTNNLDLMRNTPAKQLKIHIGNAQKKLQKKSLNEDENAFVEYINSLYSGNASENMYNVLQNLQQYNTGSKRSNNDLQMIVKDAIRSVVFDHYSNLNVNARRDLRIKVATYLIDYNAKGKNKNSTVRFSTVKVEVEGVTPKGFMEEINKLMPLRALINDTTDAYTTEIAISAVIQARKPFMSLIPEVFTTESKPKKRALRFRGKTSPTPMIPMQTLWEEERATRKRVWEGQRGQTKRTKMVVREDKPLREILTEHNVVLKVESTHSTSTTTRRRKYRHRHNKKRRSKTTSTKITTPMELKPSKKRVTFKKTTPFKDTDDSDEETKTTKAKIFLKKVKTSKQEYKETDASDEKIETTRAKIFLKKVKKSKQSASKESAETTTKRKLPRKSFGKISKMITPSKERSNSEEETRSTTKFKRTLKRLKTAKDSKELIKKKLPRNSFPKTMEAFSHRHSLPRHYFRKHNYVLNKRSQRRREEHAKLERRLRSTTAFTTTTKATTVSTTSTTDSNFILNKINHIEKELENVKHRIDRTSTNPTEATKTKRPTNPTNIRKSIATDLPFWERKPEYFVRTKKITTTKSTSTTEASEYESDDDVTVKVTTNTPRRVGTANLMVSSTKTAPKTSTSTSTISTTSAPIPTTTNSSIIMRKMVFYRSFENSTFLPIVSSDNNTIAKKLKLVVKFAEDNTKKDLKEENEAPVNENKGNETEKIKVVNDANLLTVKRKNAEDNDVLLSITIKNTTEVVVSNATIKERSTKATTEHSTQAFYGTEIIQHGNSTREELDKSLNKTGRIN